MTHPLVLLGLLVASSVGGLGYLNRNASQQPDLMPRIWGDWNARAVMGGLGLAGLVLGGPILGSIGAGLLISSIASWDTGKVWAEGIKQIQAVLPNGGPPLLPGPGGNAPPLPGGNAPPLPGGGAFYGDPLLGGA
jgi:hypothetical protein